MIETLPQHDEQDALDTALALARWGFPVFPLRPGTKVPATNRGFKDASRDPSVIRKWWKETAAYGVGVATGHGLGVVDVDTIEGHGVDGPDTLARLEREHGSLPPTPMSLTPSGGWHLWFLAPAGTKSRAGLAEGLDVKSEAGYVVGPPTSLDGGRYRWELRAHPTETPLAPIPDWLLALGGERGNGDRPAPRAEPIGEAYRKITDLLRTRGSAFRNGKWQCPAHHDPHPSLKVDEATDGKVLLHCFAGCTFQEIMTALDRPVAELFPAIEVFHEGTPTDDAPAAWYIPATELEDTGPVEWLVERLVRPGITFPAAEPKSGKTWLSLELAVAIVTGSPAFGRFEVPNPGPVLYVVEEGSAAEVRYRIGALCAGRGIPIPSGLLVAVGQGVMLDEKRWQERILAAAAEGLRAVIFDPLVRMHTADESRAESMRPVNSFLRTVAYTGTSVLVNHHWTKPNEANRAGRQGNRLRGTGDFWALCDSILYLSRLKGSPSVVVESEHRSAVEEPAWSFSLPTEQDPERLVLKWTPGGVEEIKAQQRAPEVLEAIKGAEEGITRQVLQQKVGGRAQDVDAAAAWLVGQGAVVRTEEERPDKRGRMRTQVVFRGA